MARNSEKAMELEFRAAILGTGLLQPLKLEQSGSRISALCRQVPGQERPWLVTAQNLLRAASQVQHEVHLCRKYVIKDGQMVFGWHIGLEGRTMKQLRDMVSWFAEAMAGASPGLQEVPAIRAAPPPPEPEPAAPPTSSAAVVDPAFKNDMDVRRAAAEARTSAAPRQTPTDPDKAVYTSEEPPTLRVVARGTAVNSRGQTVPTTIQEMPLPNVNLSVQDMNKPNEKGRGAKGGVA